LEVVKKYIKNQPDRDKKMKMMMAIFKLYPQWPLLRLLTAITPAVLPECYDSGILTGGFAAVSDPCN